MRAVSAIILCVVWFLGVWFLGEVMYTIWNKQYGVYVASDLHGASVFAYSVLLSFIGHRISKWT